MSEKQHMTILKVNGNMLIYAKQEALFNLEHVRLQNQVSSLALKAQSLHYENYCMMVNLVLFVRH